MSETWLDLVEEDIDMIVQMMEAIYNGEI